MATLHKPPDGFAIGDLSSLSVGELRRLARQFDPPVPVDKCPNKELLCARLQMTIAQCTGSGAADAAQLSALMTKLRDTDSLERKELCTLLDRVSRTLDELSTCDENIRTQLQTEDITRAWMGYATAFHNLLQDSTCPIIVAGQVSAGKSTLLNLLLGDEHLAVSTLPCTATVCEMCDGQAQKLELVYPDGRVVEKPFEDRDIYMARTEHSEEEFEHELVRISLPVPLLKSGISLVDSPGVGESAAVTQILLDYVSKHDVFGFIFVMKCSDGGGFLQRFKDMLRKLSKIKDVFGDRKLDPESVLFVANFWDSVAVKDRERVRQSVVRALRKEKCLQGFDPDKQLLFMDSQYAMESRKLGCITQQYNDLLQSMKQFFTLGHRKKLKHVHGWLEKMVSRALHPLHVLCYSEEDGANAEKLQQMAEQLTLLKSKADATLTTCLEYRDTLRNELLQKLRDFLALPETQEALMSWPYPRAPTGQEQIRQHVHHSLQVDLIPRALASIMEKWEHEANHFTRSETHIVNTEVQVFVPIVDELEHVERELETMGHEVHAAGSPGAFMPDYLVSFSIVRSFSSPRMYPSIVKLSEPASFVLSIMTSALKRVGVGQQESKDVMCKCVENFKTDQKASMKGMCQRVLQVIRDATETLLQIVDHELEPATEYVATHHMQLSQAIYTNLQLITVLQDKEQSQPSRFQYYLFIKQILSVLEEATHFKNKYLRRFEFSAGDLQLVEQTSDKGSMFVHMKHGDRDVTRIEKKETGPYALPLYQYEIQHRHLRSYSGEAIASYLGLHEDGCKLILDGKLMSARSYWEQCPQANRTAYTRTFIEKVAAGIQFLHQARLVHLLLSLDTVAVDEQGDPRLCGLFEPAEIPIQRNPKECEAGDYVYIAPEVLPTKADADICLRSRRSRAAVSVEFNGDRRYAPPCDVYALGMMVLEMTGDEGERSALQTLQDDTLLYDFICKQALYQPRLFLLHNSTDSPRKRFIKDCLVERAERMDIHQFITEWAGMQELL